MVASDVPWIVGLTDFSEGSRHEIHEEGSGPDDHDELGDRALLCLIAVGTRFLDGFDNSPVTTHD